MCCDVGLVFLMMKLVGLLLSGESMMMFFCDVLMRLW